MTGEFIRTLPNINPEIQYRGLHRRELNFPFNQEFLEHAGMKSKLVLLDIITTSLSDFK